MPIPLPKLDDRTFDDLVAEGKRLIPGLAPSWTDHNPSDPGIALIELFAYVVEMLLYRVDRVGDANNLAFLRLLTGNPPSWKPAGRIDEALAAAVVALQTEQRAVSVADLEGLAKAITGVGRAHGVTGHNLESPSPYAMAPGHLSLVIVPTPTETGYPFASDTLLAAVKGDRDAREPDGGLDSRCLLGTHLHLVKAKPLEIELTGTLHIYADRTAHEVQNDAARAIQRYLDPLVGGAEGSGWPFGATLHPTHLYALLDGLEGVDYVTSLALRGPTGSEGSVTTGPDELVVIPEDKLRLEIERPKTWERPEVGP